MAEGREACRDECRGGAGADGDANAFEDGGLGAVGDAIVLDPRLEIVKQLQTGVDLRGWLLERGEEGGGLVLHGG